MRAILLYKLEKKRVTSPRNVSIQAKYGKLLATQLPPPLPFGPCSATSSSCAWGMGAVEEEVDAGEGEDEERDEEATGATCSTISSLLDSSTAISGTFMSDVPDVSILVLSLGRFSLVRSGVAGPGDGSPLMPSSLLYA